MSHDHYVPAKTTAFYPISRRVDEEFDHFNLECPLGQFAVLPSGQHLTIRVGSSLCRRCEHNLGIVEKQVACQTYLPRPYEK